MGHAGTKDLQRFLKWYSLMVHVSMIQFGVISKTSMQEIKYYQEEGQ